MGKDGGGDSPWCIAPSVKALIRYQSIRDLTLEYSIYSPNPQAGVAAIGDSGSMVLIRESS